MDLTKFSIAKYKCIVKYKTAFYSFYLPVALAMILANKTDKPSHANALTILLEMGEFFQIQDDYLDCYGAPEVIGKIGTDIMDNKCGWLVVQALSRVTPSQRLILEENYGKKFAVNEAAVKALYRDLGMEKIFKDYEEESFQRLTSLIRCAVYMTFYLIPVHNAHIHGRSDKCLHFFSTAFSLCAARSLVIYPTVFLWTLQRKFIRGRSKKCIPLSSWKSFLF